MGDRKGIWPVKSWCWFLGSNNLTSFVFLEHLIAPVVTTSSIILSSKKSRMETFWYQLTHVHWKKWPLKWRERERERDRERERAIVF